MKFPNLHIFWTAGKNLAIPDTQSRNTPTKLLHEKLPLKYHKTLNFTTQKMKSHHDKNVNMQNKLTYINHK